MHHIGIPASGILFLLVVYFLPTIIGAIRKKKNLTAIFLVNLFLGWSIVGWIVALVWAASTQAVDMTTPATGYPVQPQSSPPQGKLCSICGRYNPADSRFCAHCGNAFA
jgi:hypothetical protein